MRREANYSWLPVDYSSLSFTNPANKTILIANSKVQDFDQICERQRRVVQPSTNIDGVLYSVVLPDTYLGNKQPGAGS